MNIVPYVFSIILYFAALAGSVDIAWKVYLPGKNDLPQVACKAIVVLLGFVAAVALHVVAVRP